MSGTLDLLIGRLREGRREAVEQRNEARAELAALRLKVLRYSADGGPDLNRAYKIICELLRQAGGSARIPKSALVPGASTAMSIRDDGDHFGMSTGGRL